MPIGSVPPYTRSTGALVPAWGSEYFQEAPASTRSGMKTAAASRIAVRASRSPLGRRVSLVCAEAIVGEERASGVPNAATHLLGRNLARTRVFGLTFRRAETGAHRLSVAT